MIVKHKNKYYVESKEVKLLGGPYDTQAEAEKRLKQVEMFKHIEDRGPPTGKKN